MRRTPELQHAELSASEFPDGMYFPHSRQTRLFRAEFTRRRESLSALCQCGSRRGIRLRASSKSDGRLGSTSDHKLVPQPPSSPYCPGHENYDPQRRRGPFEASKSLHRPGHSQASVDTEMVSVLGSDGKCPEGRSSFLCLIGLETGLWRDFEA